MLTTASPRPLLVAEVFGPTFQGEGPSCGRRAMFLRLSRCNLSCPSCDTPYTWDWSRFDPRQQTQQLDTSDAAARLMGHDADVVVVTGGEPLLQQRALVPLLSLLNGAGLRIEVETNGTVAPDPGVTALVSSFNVSPKLRSFAAQRDQSRRIQPEVLRTFADSGKAIFKFVAGTRADLDEVAMLAGTHGLHPVWIMPEGTSAESVLENMCRIADDVLRRGWHLTTRLHVLLWGDVRGR